MFYIFTEHKTSNRFLFVWTWHWKCRCWKHLYQAHRIPIRAPVVKWNELYCLKNAKATLLLYSAVIHAVQPSNGQLAKERFSLILFFECTKYCTANVLLVRWFVYLLNCAMLAHRAHTPIAILVLLLLLLLLRLHTIESNVNLSFWQR